MPKLILLIWPFVFRFLMNQGSEYAASYLEARRRQRFGIEQETDVPEGEEKVYLVADESLDVPLQVCTPPPAPSFFNSDPFWFTLSGIALGIALSIVAAIIKRAIAKQ